MELNWSQCIICQEEISEPLKCPLVANVEQFREMGVLPTSICFGSDITAADFETHSASWHKSFKIQQQQANERKKRVISQVQDSERLRPRGTRGNSHKVHESQTV